MRKSSSVLSGLLVSIAVLLGSSVTGFGGSYAKCRTAGEALKLWDTAVHAEIVQKRSRSLVIEEFGPEPREIGMLVLRVIDAQGKGKPPARGSSITAYYLKNTSASPKEASFREGQQVFALLIASRLAALPGMSFISGENALNSVTVNASGKAIVFGALPNDALLTPARVIGP